MSAGRAYVAGLVLGVVVLGFIGALALPPLAAHGDFAEQWGAARIALDGGDPYAPTWRVVIAQVAGRASDAAAFVYPPYVTIALIPLAMLPVTTAASLWILASTVLAAVALGAVVRRHAPHPVLAFGLGLALFASGPALLAFAQGQWSYLLLAALCAASLGTRRSIAALALLAKPALAPVPLLGLLSRRERPFVIASAVSAVVIALTLVKWDWWSEWLREELDFANARPVRTASLFTLTQPLGAAGLAIALVIVVVALFASYRSRTLPVWIASGVLVAPYIQSYDHLLLLAPLAMAPLRARVAAIGLALLFGELVLASFAAESAGAVVPLVIWAMVAWPPRR